MKLTDIERKEMVEAVRKEYLERIKKITIDRVVEDNKDRLNQYAAEISGEVLDEIRKEFPL